MKKLLLISLLATAGFGLPSFGQSLNEPFADTSISNGWTTREAGATYKWATAAYTTDASLKTLSGIADGGDYAMKSTTGYKRSTEDNPDSWLITPAVSVSDGDVLNFMMAYVAGYNGNANVADENKVKFEVAVSTTGTETADFSTVIYSSVPQDASNWNNYSLDLSSFAGKTVYIAFHTYGTPSSRPMMTNNIFIDNVKINKTKASDLSVTSVSSPVSGCATEQEVKATVHNVGFDMPSFTMHYQVDNNPAVSETVNDVLKAGSDLAYTFSTKAVLAEGATHSVKVWAEADTDPNKANDTTQVSATIGSEIEFPFTMTKDNATKAFTAIGSQAVGSRINGWGYYESGATTTSGRGWGFTRLTTRNNSFLQTNCIMLPKGKVKILFKYTSPLEAPMNVYLVTENGKYDNVAGHATLAVATTEKSGELAFDVPQDGVYKIALQPSTTSYSGPLYLDDIRITDQYDDVATTAILSPVNNASLPKDAVTVKARFHNGSNKEVTDLKVAYSIDGITATEETVASIPADGDAEYEFTQKANLSATGSHTLKVWAELASDITPDNDTISRSIDVYTAHTLPYKTGFEDAHANKEWIISNPDNDYLAWGFYNMINSSTNINYAKDGVIAAYISSVSGIQHNDWLVSPAITATKGAARISFYYTTQMRASGTDGCTLDVYLAKTDDIDQIKLGTPVTRDTITDANVLQYAQGYASVQVPEDGNYYIAFHNGGTGHDVILDDVRFDRDEDLCMLGGTNTATSGFNLTDNTVKVKFANHGTTARTSIPLSYSVNGTSPVTETYEGTVEPGQTAEYTFKEKVDLTADGPYKIIATVDENGDADTYNNSWTLPEINHQANATIPYDENFDNNDTRLYWADVPTTWVPASNMTSSRSAYNGTGGLYHNGKAADNGDWVFSGCIEIPAGTYDMSFFYRTFLNQTNVERYGQNFEIMLGTAPSADSMSTSIFKGEGLIAATKQYVKEICPFKVDRDGQYYIGIKNYSTSAMGCLFMDQISIAKPSDAELTLGTYTSDFENRESEWYHYNPSSVFAQWKKTNIDGNVVMQTTRQVNNWSGTPSELPGAYVAPAFHLTKGTQVKAGFDYAISIGNPANLSDEEKQHANITLYVGDKDLPQAFTTAVATGNTADGQLNSATGTWTAPADGNYYFAFLADGPQASTTGDVTVTYDLYSLTLENAAPSGISQTPASGSAYAFDGRTLTLNSDNNTISIYTSNGSLVRTYANTRSIDLSRLHSGVYLVKIVTPDGTVNSKIFVK